MKPHKHADILKAIADGKDVQCLHVNGTNAEWDNNWLWEMFGDPCYIWRIKPKEPVKRWLYAYIEDGVWVQGQAFFSDEEIKKVSNTSMIKLLWSEMEFDE